MGKVVVEGLDEFLKDLERMEREMSQASRKMMNTIGEVVKGEVKSVTPVDTGELRSKIFFKTLDEKTVLVYNNMHYAAYVEYGTRKQKGQFYMKRGVNSAAKIIPRIVNKYVKEVLK